MSDLLTIPMQDDFETELSSSWNGAVGTISVKATPAGTIPSGKYSYIVVNPGESNMQVAKISGWDSGAKTITVSSIDVPSGQGGNYSAQNHAANAVVRFSNNYAFWKDIMDAIASKADNTDLGDFVFSGSNQTIAGSNFRIRKNGNSMKFRDDETSEVTLKQLAEGNGADQYFAISENDTTVGHLEDKVTFGDGIKGTKVNPGGNEQMDIDIDVTDTTIFVKTSSGAVDENKVPVLNASGKVADGFINTTPILSSVETSLLNGDVILITKNTADANTTTTYNHGLGRTPREISFVCNRVSTGFGCFGSYVVGGTQKCVYYFNLSDATKAIKVTTSPGSDEITGLVKNLTSTTFDIEWVKTGSGVGNMTVLATIR